MIGLALAIAFQLSAGVPATPHAPLSVSALVARARSARIQQDSMLAEYHTLVRQRMSSSIGLAAGLGLGPIGRERLAARYEAVARVGWHHELGAWGEIIGARAVVPMLGMVDPDGGDDDVALTLPYYPGRDRLWPMSELRDALPNAEEWIAHPLYAGADSVYDFSIGDSLSIRLPDQSVIQLREIRVRPRRPASRLIVGSLWVDMATGNLVRAAYRPSVPVDLWPFMEREIGRDDREKVKKFGPFTGIIREVVIDHGLYEGRFWLPKTRIASAEGTARGGRVTLSIEQTFEYQKVRAIPPGSRVATRIDSVDIDPRTGRVRQPTWRGVQNRRNRCRATGDSLNPRWDPDSLLRDDRLTVMSSEGVRFRVLVPCDKDLLVSTPLLPGSIYSASDELFPQADLAALRRDVENALGFSKQAKWNPQPATIYYGIDRGMVRFNRVEGVSAGIMVEQVLGAGYTAGGLVRIGIADLQPLAEAFIDRSNMKTNVRLTGYRRLATANDWGNPLGAGASLTAALFGRDDGFYYRTLGAEVGGTHRPKTDGIALSWRLFGERQSEAVVETQRSLANMLNGVRFLPNITAHEGMFWGSAGVAQFNWGVDPRGTRLFASTRVEAATGAASYGRAMTDLMVTRGLGSRTLATITGAAGSSVGDVPIQRFWYLGGAHTIHAQPAGALAGDAFWLARAELTRGNPLVRPILFGDVGWAGPRSEWATSYRPLNAVGAGLAMLDGLVRLDVSRPVTRANNWRVDLYFEVR
jgi:hypothetical protein